MITDHRKFLRANRWRACRYSVLIKRQMGNPRTWAQAERAATAHLLGPHAQALVDFSQAQRRSNANGNFDAIVQPSSYEFLCTPG
jgi:hypothetical protein